MELVFNIIKGVMIGIANVIPGVSGGTMAVSFGIYDRLISSISGFTKHVKESLALLATFFWAVPWASPASPTPSNTCWKTTPLSPA